MPVAAQEAVDMRLADAGFVMRVAKDAAEMERLGQLPPRRMVARTIDGKRFFLYADPAGCRCVMVGDQQALQTYRTMRASPSQIPNMPPSGINVEDSVIRDMDQDLGSDLRPNDILSVPY